jgi:hypothetical protein
LLAYAIAPLAIKAFIELLEDQDNKNFVKTLFWITLVGVFNVQILILTLFIYAVFSILKIVQIRKDSSKKLLKTLSLLGLSFLVLNMYWLLPTITAKATLLSQIGEQDLYIYATKASAFNTAFTTASMYGFWRGGYIYTKDLLPYWYLLFVFILFLAVHGFMANYKDKKIGTYVKGLGIVAVVGLVLGSGVYGPFSEMFNLLYDRVSFFRGFRDSHKFVALLALGYAYLGSLGIEGIKKEFKDRAKREKVVSMLIVALALVTPFIYSFTIFNGFWGQLGSVDYPNDWYEMNEFLNNDTQDFNILFFPWHAYMDFKWLPNAQKRLLNPAASFFDKPVIIGENAEVGGVYTYSTSPVQRYIQFLLDKKDNITNLGELLVPLNVKYVLLTKEADYKKYFFLFNQGDLELVRETENFYVFKNQHNVSVFYQTDDDGFADGTGGDIENLVPLGYTKLSPVKYAVDAPDKRYIVFVPPNFDSNNWELDGVGSLRDGYYAVYPASSVKKGAVYYRRFDTYLLGYAVSLITMVGLVLWYGREGLRGRLERVNRGIRWFSG